MKEVFLAVVMAIIGVALACTSCVRKIDPNDNSNLSYTPVCIEGYSYYKITHSRTGKIYSFIPAYDVSGDPAPCIDITE